MKTKRRVLKKVGQFFCISLLAIGIQSCETEIPLDDRTPPEFSFQITGPGVNYTFDQDFDYENYELNLKTGVTYDFTLTGSDQGGVRRIRWQIRNKNNFILQNEVSHPWNTSEFEQKLNIFWYGDEANPFTGNIFSESFRTDSSTSTNYFVFEVDDFGGESGSPNTISKELRVDLTDYHPGVRRKWGR